MELCRLQHNLREFNAFLRQGCFVVAGTVRGADVQHIGVVAPLERQTAC
jgi:hypothetical protein